MNQDSSNVQATVDSPEKEEPSTQKNQESPSSWLEGIGNIVKWLVPHERLPGTILLSVIAALVLTIWKVPAEKSMWVVVLVISLVVFSLMVYLFFTSSTKQKLGKLKKDKKTWDVERRNLDRQILLLEGNNRKSVETNSRVLNEIHRKIHTIHIMINNSERSDTIIKTILEVADDIQNQIGQNASTINDGIDAAKNSKRYTGELLEGFPDLRSQKLKKKT